MRIAVLGAGAIGLGLAAIGESLGHDVAVHSPSGKSTAFLKEGRALLSEGALEGTWRPQPATLPVALDGAELVIFAAPANAMGTLIEEAASRLGDAHNVVISSQSSFAALVLRQRLLARGVRVPIAAWSTTLSTGRRLAADRVQVDEWRSRVDVAFLDDGAGRLAALQGALFGERFHRVPDLLALSLSNLNPPIHLANALCNLTRIERGEAWDNYDGITPAVARLILALDAERIALAEAFGYRVKTVEEHYVHTFPIAPASLAEMAAEVHRMKQGPRGPTSIATRYITEDVPFGILPIVALARARGVAVPVHEGGLALLSAIAGTDFTAANDLLPAIADLLAEPERLAFA
ncbi:MAG: NAD/NADP octopine/nopaline dehydrogenase family protein [Acuticoccus sp.]